MRNWISSDLRLLVLRQTARRLARSGESRRGYFPEGASARRGIPHSRVGQPSRPLVAKLHKLDAALRAFALIEGIGFLALLDLADAPLVQRALLQRLLQILEVALVAQVQFFVLFLANHFGDVHRWPA